MKFLAKIINGIKPLAIFSKSPILDVWLGFEYTPMQIILVFCSYKKVNTTSLEPSHASGFFLYLLRTSENLWFSDVFRGSRKKAVARNGLLLTPYAPTPQNGQTHQNNSLETAVWVCLIILWGWRLKGPKNQYIYLRRKI